MSEIINFPRRDSTPEYIEKAWEIVMGEVYEKIGHRAPNEYIEEFAKLFRPMFENLIPININIPLITDPDEPFYDLVKDMEHAINGYVGHSIRTRRDRELLWFLREKYGVWGNE